MPCLRDTTCHYTTERIAEIFGSDCHFFGQIEDLKDILVRLHADGTEKSRYREFLLTVDISIHHIVDVCSKLNPAAAERNDTCGI